MILNHDQINANHGECLGLLRTILATGNITPYIMKSASRVVDEIEEHDKSVRKVLLAGIDEVENGLEQRLEKAEYLESR